MMDIWQQKYYKINKFFLQLIGLWPYQSRFARYFILVSIIILVGSQLVPQIIAVVKYWDDTELILESISPLIIDISCGTKIANIIINWDKMLKIIKRIESDWAWVSRYSEIHIIREYAELGRTFTLIYAVGVYLITLVYLTQPFLPRILELISPVNHSQPLKFPIPIDYVIIDYRTHYGFMIIHVFVCTGMIVTVLIAADTLFIVQIQHACGMFAVIGHRLKHMADIAPENDKQYSRSIDDPTFRYMRVCIERHNAMIEFSDLIEDSYTWTFFALVGLNMIAMSITGYQISTSIDRKQAEALRFIGFAVAQIVHLFYQSYFSQRLKDHSEGISEYISQAEWYKTPLCTQKLLGLVTTRASVPCQLTAGKMLPMSLETFKSVMKTSMSYFAVLRSMS